MTSLDDVRAALADARSAQEAAAADRVAAVAAVRRAQADLATAQRSADRQTVAAASATLDAATGAADQAHGSVRSAAAQVEAALRLSADLTDPRKLVTQFGPTTPTLLFPVRLEVRFHGGQLWVRVFPDTCLVDTFSPDLTVAEVTDARFYWTQVWRAGGDEGGERAAWRAMATAHGSGRSAWVVDTYQPANPADQPVKGSAAEVVLVTWVSNALTAADQAAVIAFWTAWWRAGTDSPARQAARSALTAAVGATAAAAYAERPPAGIDTEPTAPDTRATATVTVAVAVLPDRPDAVPTSWNRAPRADLLPDRFVLVLENGPEAAPTTRVETLGLPVPPAVFTGPDPLAPEADQLRPVDGRLELPDQLAWLADFDRAVADGLGFVVDLTPDQAAAGFDRAYVLGVRALESADDSAAGVATLLRHHYSSRAGLELVPQGTPTNNTEGKDSGYRSVDDPDASFDARAAGPVPDEPDPALRTDGQWLADLLGIDSAALTAVPGTHGLDQRDARAMQTLLWPATMGYLLSTMLAPVVSDETVEDVRWFFTQYVRGRGAVPAIRIGAQPYGVLPTTAFSRSSWLDQQQRRDVGGRGAFLRELERLLTVAEQSWVAALGQVPTLGRGEAPITDAHQTLLGMLGLHPGSAEFQYRYGEGFEQLVNQANLSGFGRLLFEAWERAALDGPALALLASFGSAGPRPPLLDLYFHGRQATLTGPLVDDRPVSETLPIRSWTTDDRNYLHWLHDAATTSLDALRAEAGFADDAPTTLLFLLIQQALTLGYHDGARELHGRAGYPVEVLAAMRLEPSFVHVAPEGVSESRYEPLYRHDPLISPGEDWTVAAQITHLLGTPTSTRLLAEQLAALDRLSDATTGRLERALVEHLDTVGYRLDAWRLGLVSLQLEQMRASNDGNGEGEGDDGGDGGLYVGAYGWLEDVRPKPTRLVPAELSPDLVTVFGNDPPLMVDPTNGGHLLAPSLNQAVTASVLRSAYLANASSADPTALAVNLSSARVRDALDVIDGVRQGQSMSALLGYALERGLHDSSPVAEVDVFIYSLRRKFPLAAEQLQSTSTDAGTPIQAVQARDVVDGVALVNHLESTAAYTYPFGLTPAEIPPADGAQQGALNAQMDRLRDLRDAVGDLALAEAVHHATQGGADRAGATLSAYQSGQLPPEVEVVRTPTNGVTLTHRVGLHLDPTPAAGTTPRSVAEPAVDAYLGGLLPPLSTIACVVAWTDPVDGTAQSTTVRVGALGLRPIDVVELLRGDDQAMTELDDRVIRQVVATAAPRSDAVLEIRYRDGGGHTPVFEVAALTSHLRGLLTSARPLRATDVTAPGEASADLDAGAAIDQSRLVSVQATLATLASDADTFLATWEPLVADVDLNRAAILAGGDSAVDAAVELLARGALHAVPGSGWGAAVADRQAQYAATAARLRARAAAWLDRLSAINARLTAYDLLPAATPVPDRLAELVAIESLIRPAVGVQDPDPVTQRTVVGGLRDGLVGRRLAVLAVADGSASGLVALRTAVLGLMPFTDVDSDPFETDSLEQAMVTLVQDVVASVRSLADAAGRRLTSAQTALDAAAAAADGPSRLAALQDCAAALLGDTALVVPTFTMPAAQATEWAQARGSVATLLDHLTTDPGSDFPVDDWLHSAARVREPLRHAEEAGLLAEAFGRPEQAFLPIQLPHRPDDRWLAMEYPPTQDLSGEHLLYTAAYPAGFSASGPACGLLLDEWTEVLPSDTATPGLAFNYDQPSSEAPQTMLLVTPASGRWSWDDLRQAIPDTMRLAKLRAVEPVQLGEGAVARFLPATISAITERLVSISLPWAINNGVRMERLEVPHD